MLFSTNLLYWLIILNISPGVLNTFFIMLLLVLTISLLECFHCLYTGDDTGTGFSLVGFLLILCLDISQLLMLKSQLGWISLSPWFLKEIAVLLIHLYNLSL